MERQTAESTNESQEPISNFRSSTAARIAWVLCALGLAYGHGIATGKLRQVEAGRDQTCQSLAKTMEEKLSPTEKKRLCTRLAADSCLQEILCRDK